MAHCLNAVHQLQSVKEGAKMKPNISRVGAWLQDKASSFILDLRDNSGGVVAAGYNIAQLLLQDGDGFCIVKFGSGEEEVVQMQQTSHLVTEPMVCTNSCKLC